MKRVPVLLAAIVLTACSSKDIGPYAPTAEDKQNEALAAQKAMCAIEIQERCAHVIENRIVMSRFFAPQSFGGFNEEEKLRGRRLTTRYVVEAVAAIKQCRPVTEDSVVLLRDVQISGRPFLVKASKPVGPEAACFITPEPEAS